MRHIPSPLNPTFPFRPHPTNKPQHSTTMKQHPHPCLALQPNLVQDNVAAEVAPRVYIGSVHASFNQEHLAQLGITHILDAAGLPPTFPHLFTYLSLSLHDKEGANVLACLPAALLFIEAALQSPSGAVLVHCHAGRSRSASVLTAYLMKAQGLDFEGAVARVRAARPVVQLNQGFEDQLRAYGQQKCDVFAAHQHLLRQRLLQLAEARQAAAGADGTTILRATSTEQFFLLAEKGSSRGKTTPQHGGETTAGMTLPSPVASFTTPAPSLPPPPTGKGAGAMSWDKMEDEDLAMSPRPSPSSSSAASAGRPPRPGHSSLPRLVVMGEGPSNQLTMMPAARTSPYARDRTQPGRRPRPGPLKGFGPTTGDAPTSLGLPTRPLGAQSKKPPTPQLRLTRPTASGGAAQAIPHLQAFERGFHCMGCSTRLFTLGNVLVLGNAQTNETDDDEEEEGVLSLCREDDEVECVEEERMQVSDAAPLTITTTTTTATQTRNVPHHRPMRLPSPLHSAAPASPKEPPVPSHRSLYTSDGTLRDEALRTAAWLTSPVPTPLHASGPVLHCLLPPHEPPSHHPHSFADAESSTTPHSCSSDVYQPASAEQLRWLACMHALEEPGGVLAQKAMEADVAACRRMRLYQKRWIPVELLPWMDDAVIQEEAGVLRCPTCTAEVGKWDWSEKLLPGDNENDEGVGGLPLIGIDKQMLVVVAPPLGSSSGFSTSLSLATPHGSSGSSAPPVPSPTQQAGLPCALSSANRFTAHTATSSIV